MTQPTQPIKTLLVANRGEIAVRIMRTARSMGIKTVAVYSDADKNAMHVRAADVAVHIGAAAASESYLIAERIIDACKRTGADAVHPGYGFLSENPDFADALAAENIRFLGPSGDAMRAMALKGEAKKLMQDAGVPVVPGYHGDDQTDEGLAKAARDIGFPVLLKAVAGGGGKGMRQVHKEEELIPAIQAARREGENSFGNGILLVEKYIEKPRHIEIQVFGDTHGHVVHLWERDCSLQRRHQKVVEEAPAPGMSKSMRQAMGSAAVKAAEAINYAGAGTVEFIVDVANGLDDAPFYFMEMNTRLQVEHPVTEEIMGQDLVAWQIRVAEGENLPFAQDELDLMSNGHAVEVRLYAEDPLKGFLPSTGTVELFDPNTPLLPDCRIDAGVRAGDQVSVHYDPMIAKVIAWADTREQAIDRLLDTLKRAPVSGLATNSAFLSAALDHPSFRKGDLDTGFIARFEDDLIKEITPKAADYARAALCIIAHRNAVADPADTWGAASGGFRLNLDTFEHLGFDDAGGERIRVDVRSQAGDYQLSVLGEDFTGTADAMGGTDYRVTLDGLKETITADINAETVKISHDGTLHTLTRHSRTGALTEDADGPGTITAPMPGKILSVAVKNGDTVERGDALLVMEAMKMEQTLSAPRAGTVSGLSLNAGDLVADGATLLTITDDADT